jgi:hypothetical protein
MSPASATCTEQNEKTEISVHLTQLNLTETLPRYETLDAQKITMIA